MTLMSGCVAESYSLDGVTLNQPIKQATKQFGNSCTVSPRILGGVDFGGSWYSCRDRAGADIAILSFNDEVATIILRGGDAKTPTVADPFGVRIGDSIASVEQKRGKPTQEIEGGIGYFASPRVISWYEGDGNVVSGIRLAVYPHPMDFGKVLQQLEPSPRP